MSCFSFFFSSIICVVFSLHSRTTCFIYISSHRPLFLLPFQITATASSISPMILLDCDSYALTDMCLSRRVELAAPPLDLDTPPLRQCRPTAWTSPTRRLSLQIHRRCRRIHRSSLSSSLRRGGVGFGDSSSSTTKQKYLARST